MIRLAVRVARADAEPVLAELLELAPAGLEERDVDAATVEYVLYGAPGELPALPDLRAAAGHALVEVSTSEVADGWEERWREWHRPVDAGPIRVRPPWAPPRDGAVDVVIDPGQAFGTGAHPSTRLSLELLAGMAAARGSRTGSLAAGGTPPASRTRSPAAGETPPGSRTRSPAPGGTPTTGSAGPSPLGALADWGCGSGILSVAAAKLGWAPVSACDVELAAVEATREAACANGVELAAVERCDVRRGGGPWAPTVAANLVRPLLLEVAGALERPPERLLASGLTLDEVDDVVAAFARHGLHLADRRDGDGWSAILLAR